MITGGGREMRALMPGSLALGERIGFFIAQQVEELGGTDLEVSAQADV
jgi:hypothetical protein